MVVILCQNCGTEIIEPVGYDNFTGNVRCRHCKKDTWVRTEKGEIKELKRPGDPIPKGSYALPNLHPRIRDVSGNLFRDGHYAQAILEAYKAVAIFVKERSGRQELDGQKLMSTVFNSNNPILRLNDLQDQSDRDEQEGFKFLFMGAMTGIRNPKAHNIVNQTDPISTIEYLALASLLARRVEESK